MPWRKRGVRSHHAKQEELMQERNMAKEAFGVLCQLLEKELGFGGTSRRPFSRLWAFSWGEISVVWQMQDLSVHVGIAWQEAGSDQ